MRPEEIKADLAPLEATMTGVLAQVGYPELAYRFELEGTIPASHDALVALLRELVADMGDVSDPDHPLYAPWFGRWKRRILAALGDE